MVQCYMQAKKMSERFIRYCSPYPPTASCLWPTWPDVLGRGPVDSLQSRIPLARHHCPSHTRKVLCGADVLVVVEGCDPNSGDVADG